MQSTFEFRGNEFIPLAICPIETIDEDDFTGSLQKHGFSLRKYGHPEVPAATIWRRHVQDDDDGYAFFVEVDIGAIGTMDVWVRDWPSLLNLLGRIHGLVAFELMQKQFDTIELFSNKMFQATHGHDLAGVCKTCDPYTWDRMQQNRRSREQSLPK